MATDPRSRAGRPPTRRRTRPAKASRAAPSRRSCARIEPTNHFEGERRPPSEGLDHRPDRNGDRRDPDQEMRRARAVPAEKRRTSSRPPELESPHPLRVVDPGQRLNDDPRREAVIEREVGAVDPQGEQPARVGRLGSVECRPRPARSATRSRSGRGRLSGSTARAAPPGSSTPARRARSRSGTPVHVCVRRPPLDAGDWQLPGRERQRNQVVARELENPCALQLQPPARTGMRGCDPRRGRGLLT